MAWSACLLQGFAAREYSDGGMAGTTTLDQVLSELAREGELLERLPGGRVRCHACGHRCLIPPGQRGVCKVRWNDGGRLMVPHGYVAALQLDPVEKKPWCPSCGALLVERAGYHVRQDRLRPTGGACPDCATQIAGVWA
jgi:hypothetical protein